MKAALTPYVKSIATNHIVPVMSKPLAPCEVPITYQGRDRPPRKYALRFFEARLDSSQPRAMTARR